MKAYYPAAIAPAIAKPSAADFPRPRAASKATVLRSVLSKIVSRNVATAFPCSNIYQLNLWVILVVNHVIQNLELIQIRKKMSTWSNVQHFFIKGPTGNASLSCSFRSFNSLCDSDIPSESFNHDQETKQNSSTKLHWPYTYTETILIKCITKF